MQCEKHTKSGKLLEIDFYPVFDDGRKMPVRSKKEKKSTKAQEKYNRNQAVKKFIRMINANFDNTDYRFDATYIPSLAPQSEETARKDFGNYIRRVKTKRAAVLKSLKNDLKSAKTLLQSNTENEFIKKQISEIKQKIKKLEQPFKYAYSIEEEKYKTGCMAGKSNYHFHVFVTGGLSDKIMESLWTKGIRCNCDNYNPEKFGPEAAARYLMKNPQGQKSFAHSKNMRLPSEQKKLGSVSRGQVEKMARLRVDDRAYWEKRHKGYKFIRCFSRYNEYNGNWYVSVVMFRTDDEPPKWDMAEWNLNF